MTQYWADQKVRSGFPVTAYEKPEQIFGPTQYLVTGLSKYTKGDPGFRRQSSPNKYNSPVLKESLLHENPNNSLPHCDRVLIDLVAQGKLLV